MTVKVQEAGHESVIATALDPLDASHTVPPWLRRHYRRLQFLFDAAVLTAALAIAYVLRFDFSLGSRELQNLATQLPFVVLVQLTALVFSGAHQRVWRYTNLRDLPTFLRAAAYATGVVFAVRFAPFTVLAGLKVPISIIVMDAGLAFTGVVAIRVVRRWVDEKRQQSVLSHEDGERLPVILVGAGRAGVLAAREIANGNGAGIEPVGFVDDDPLKQNSVIGGIRVLGTTADLPRLVRQFEVDHVVLTIADILPAQKKHIVSICRRIPVKVREIPGYYEVLQGAVSFSRMRDVDPESLLGREPIRMDEAQLRAYLGGRRVLVTGAGGSIGSELGRQIARFHPDQLLLVERNEYALFETARQLSQAWPELQVASLLADIGDEGRMATILADYRPDLVVHAAAHKHVPMMELQPCEAITNNVVGTCTIGELAGEHGVKDFILVSTDKAVRPTSVMGASKRVAELVIQDLNARYATTYAGVRFGNVLGSTGSVIPIFRQQIAAGGPVTVTDSEMKRYFMSIPEAAQLVLRAGSLASGGEIFVLDMGEPVKIIELAEKMIRLSGFEPYEEIPIVITGRRRGEKLFEELGSDAEDLSLTRHPKIFVGQLEPYETARLAAGLERMRHLAAEGDGDAIRAYLGEFLPEAGLEIHFGPSEPRAAGK